MIKVASIGLHHGEEPPISGSRGSGAIFLSACNLQCVFCQNYQISQEGLGHFMTEDELADEMLGLEDKGAHNINLVSPTHFGPQILVTLGIAKKKGLKLPIVYNTNGYDPIELLKQLEGLVDIYLPDIKYSDDENALKYSKAKEYVEINRKALSEMFRQVGELELDNDGIAKRGLIVRHLVLPDDIAGSYGSLKFLASLSKDIWISIMAQYAPCYKAKETPELNRKITSEEYERVLDWAEELGFNNVLTQELDSSEVYFPDFEKINPFGKTR